MTIPTARAPADPMAAAPTPDRLFRRFVAQVNAAGMERGPGDDSPVTTAEVADLPEVVRRYFAFMAVVGQPRVWSLRARFVGTFRLRPRSPWLPAEAWQYDSGLAVARVFVMRLRFGGVVPMVGSDTYLRGRGRMVGKLFNRVTVADGEGDEFDVGELTTYLNDAVLLAPSMLLGLPAWFRAVDRDSFEVGLTDHGRTVRARVFVDPHGAPYDFRTTDRFADLPSGLVRAEWRTPVSGWRMVGGRPIPGRLEAVWHLPAGADPGGTLPYVTGELTHVAYNLPPPS